MKKPQYSIQIFVATLLILKYSKFGGNLYSLILFILLTIITMINLNKEQKKHDN